LLILPCAALSRRIRPLLEELPSHLIQFAKALAAASFATVILKLFSLVIVLLPPMFLVIDAVKVMFVLADGKADMTPVVVFIVNPAFVGV